MISALPQRLQLSPLSDVRMGADSTSLSLGSRVINTKLPSSLSRLVSMLYNLFSTLTVATRGMRVKPSVDLLTNSPVLLSTKGFKGFHATHPAA